MIDGWRFFHNSLRVKELALASASGSAVERPADGGKPLFHQPGSPTPPSAPSKSQGARWLGWGLILAGLLVIGAWSAATGGQLVGRVRSLQAHLQYLEVFAQGDAGGMGLAELESAGEHLAGMRQDLEAIQSQVGPLLPAGRLLRWLPRHGGDLAAASDLLDIAVGLASAGDRTFQALSPAFDLFDGSAGNPTPAQSAGERLLPVLLAAQPELQAAQDELAAVEEAQIRIDAQILSPRVASLLDRLDRYRPWFETAVEGALLIPGLLGADGPRTYLIVAQNNQELRATGGFISGVGELRVEGGRLGSLSFDDSYAVDNLNVPHELTPLDFQRVLWGQLWFFRDTNWDADFPTSAQRALDVYARDRGVQADGVIALDLSALRFLVDAVGPLQMEGTANPVTSHNILQVAQAQWNEPTVGSGQDWWSHRKDFMGQIASAVMDRLATLRLGSPPRKRYSAGQAGQDLQPVRLARALKQALDEKHVLIYLTDLQAASLLREQDWDGALTIPPFPSDALLIVDSNVGFNKVDAKIARSIHYQVDLAAQGGPRARLTLTYQHRATRPVGDCVQESHYGDTYADMMERCYWDYVRVYVPAGSRLLAGPGLPLPPGSLLARNSDPLAPQSISPTLAIGGWAVWTAFFALPTMEERTLTFDYQLPEGVLDRDPNGSVHYRLRVQKQPGTKAVPLRVEFTLPPTAELVAARPAGLPVMDTDLRTDRDFEIVFRRGKEGP